MRIDVGGLERNLSSRCEGKRENEEELHTQDLNV
jgi:hypothetical protein